MLALKRFWSRENCRCRQSHCRLTHPLQETPANIYALYCHQVVTRPFFAADSKSSLHSNFRGGLRKHILWHAVRNDHSRSSKVTEFGTNRKRVCDFLLVIAPILQRFGDGDLLAKKRQFSLTHLHLTPSLGMNPFYNFWMNLISPRPDSLVYPSVKILWS